MGDKKYNTFSVLAIIFAFVFSPLGLIFGIVALSQIKKTGEEGKALAIVSIILGALAILSLVAVGIIWIVVRTMITRGA